MAKKFENTRSEIHAFVINIEKMEKREEVFISENYVRSEKKAEEILRAALEIADDEIIKINEIIQHNAAAKTYDIKRMIHDGFILEDNARPIADYEKCIPVIQYFYTANVYAEDSECNPYANTFSCESLNKFTKGNAREYVEMRYNEYHPYKVVAITNVKREEVTKYIIGTVDEFNKYEEK